jgi:hypothetical protein
MNTWHKILETNLSNGKKKYIFIPRIFVVINVCNQGKNLCSPCTLSLLQLKGNKSKNLSFLKQETLRPWSSEVQRCVIW